MKVVIIDLDGTLCNTEHRQHHMEKQPKNWNAFYSALCDDVPNEWCLVLARAMRELQVGIILVSGRPDTYQMQTEEWLYKYFPKYDRLFMRAAGDYRKDAIVKTEIYRKYIEPDYDVLFCVDDRQQVVDAWRELGLTCLQCAKGDF